MNIYKKIASLMLLIIAVQTTYGAETQLQKNDLRESFATDFCHEVMLDAFEQRNYAESLSEFDALEGLCDSLFMVSIANIYKGLIYTIGNDDVPADAQKAAIYYNIASTLLPLACTYSRSSKADYENISEDIIALRFFTHLVAIPALPAKIKLELLHILISTYYDGKNNSAADWQKALEFCHIALAIPEITDTDMQDKMAQIQHIQTNIDRTFSCIYLFD